MEEIRCGSCNRKLAEGEYTRLAIKCPRCGALNQLSAPSAYSKKENARGHNSNAAPKTSGEERL
nr:Com family DNA-binding transcriptional regulator [uncultured Comamonas sp.]